MKNFFKTMKFVVSVFLGTATLLTTSGSYAGSLTKGSMTSSARPSVLYITQDIPISASDNGVINMVAGPVTSSSSGFGIGKNAMTVRNTQINSRPRIPVSNPTTSTDAIDSAINWSHSMRAFQVSVSSFLQRNGLSSAIYNFNQEINITTESGIKKKSINFIATIDNFGRIINGDPKIVDADPTILDVTYTPLAMGDDLPPSWNFPNAGKIQYRLLNKLYQPITQITTVDVAGAFDEKDGDMQAQVACLVDLRYPNCSAPIDMKALMSKTGASFGVLSYIRKITPEYVKTGSNTFAPVSSISVNTNEQTCDSIIQTGTYGYSLLLSFEKYFIQEGSPLYPYQLLAQASGKMTSPTATYNKSVTIASLGSASPSSVVLNPYPTGSGYWLTSDAEKMKFVSFLAPLSQASSSTDDNVTLSSNSGDQSAYLYSNDGNGEKTYLFGTPSAHIWSWGVYDRTYNFNVPQPGSLKEIALIAQNYDDWLLINVNGNTVYVGPYGGNTLEVNDTQTGSFEMCKPNGGVFDCYKGTTYPGRFANTATPPAGCFYQDNGFDAFTTTEYCYVSSQPYCELQQDSDTGVSRYVCYASPCGGGVLYNTWDGKSKASCGPMELIIRHDDRKYVNLQSYLVPGNNTIFARTVIGGTGDSKFLIRTKTCGTSTPPPPTNNTYCQKAETYYLENVGACSITKNNVTQEYTNCFQAGWYVYKLSNGVCTAFDAGSDFYSSANDANNAINNIYTPAVNDFNARNGL